MGRIVGGICSCFELDDEVRERQRESETEKGLGIVWQDEKKGRGYFGSPKEKVVLRDLKRTLTNLLTLMKGVIQHEKEETVARDRCMMLARKEVLGKIEEKEKQGAMSRTDHNKRRDL